MIISIADDHRIEEDRYDSWVTRNAQARVPPLHDRFGYLLKHARDHLAALSDDALRPFGINGRQLAVLMVLADGEPASQHEAARRLAVDRTTMVELIDRLEAMGLVERRPDATDRRRNIVALTDAGSRTLVGASGATDAAEATFLAPLSRADADRLRALLQAVVEPARGVTRRAR